MTRGVKYLTLLTFGAVVTVALHGADVLQLARNAAPESRLILLERRRTRLPSFSPRRFVARAGFGAPTLVGLLALAGIGGGSNEIPRSARKDNAL
ncbi:MAG: hypothetical protein NZ556_00170 [Fimbriimonadales bacterium]|nr:hypothetical protein [Fimbriimonadales bacterium]